MGAGDAAATQQQGNGAWLREWPDLSHQHQCAIDVQQRDVRVDVVLDGNGVDDEVKARLGIGHGFFVRRDEEPVGTEGQSVGFLAV
jgi:hypothetical protein